ncbi:MAG: RagB/SusD family nutrient uptake outer membrane protein [Gemmatimonadetes bacterium]|nr:RagB/SusD family nutrient uptake outer membrane protein [Gemmatimonadota bacterium]
MTKASRQPMLLGTALMFLAAGTLFGCKDSFLTDAAAAQGVLDQSVLANSAGVEGNLIAAYRSLDYTNGVGGSQCSAASDWCWASVPSDDAYKGTEPSDFTALNDIELFHWNTGLADGVLNDKWKAIYEGVSRTNATLQLMAQVVKDKPAEISAANQAGIKGEAYFLRAHYMFEAYKIFGNVPYLREADTDLRKAAENKAAVGADILKDLDVAIANLGDTPRNGQVGRATKWTATAYKGKVLMYLGQYANALPILKSVVASGKYSLQPSFDQVWTGFKAYENGPETIFAYQASANDGEPNGNNANYGERLNFPHSGSPFGCCGFHQPSQNLVNFFKTDAAGLPLALSDPANWNSDNQDLRAAVTGNMNFDPRLDWTAGRNGVPFKDWGAHDSTWIRNIPNGGTYSAKKNVHEKASGAQSSVGWVNTQLNSVNIHILRYADILLLLAEAEVQTGDLANAMIHTNMVRTRAAVKAQGPGTSSANIAVPINDPSITWAKYVINPYPATYFVDAATALKTVKTERRLELAMEGQRFFDLKRWGEMQTTMAGYFNGVGGGNEKSRRLWFNSAELPVAKHDNYPIPVTQVELSKVNGEVRVPQNTGW